MGRTSAGHANGSTVCPRNSASIKRDDPQELKTKAAEWRKEHVWSPNQLRHTAATEIRRAADRVEISKTILGNSDLSATDIYAERALAEAAEAIAKIG